MPRGDGPRLPGASSVAQLEQNLAALEKLDFRVEELDAIEGILAG